MVISEELITMNGYKIKTAVQIKMGGSFLICGYVVMAICNFCREHKISAEQ